MPRLQGRSGSYRPAAVVATALLIALPTPAALAISRNDGPLFSTAKPESALAANSAPAARDKNAQDQGAGKSGASSAPAETPTSSPEERPLYEGQMLRLAEVLGALSFLRNLCGANDAPQWYEKMRALIDAEASTAAERERLAGSYNRGFNGYALTYRRCNASAQAAITRFLDEGARLATTISSRFGG
ncbi:MULTISPECIES: TIGR02301 family protein [unclassified Chelatococcus]|uniref:TIGR02301 family protein n=1 Tax=unclassified Chelatococcus TaxID=2638111 RepID=UPI001BCBFA16|nr:MULTISPECIES: TIGR02301 family protein [unclassified Chelatococcus]MBS7698317.1 TIGR02301 family protein [Chelatococcus sp. YT9]MBX3559174.1 TIGR02301 family protein [Chelatococcus sp.]